MPHQYATVADMEDFSVPTVVFQDLTNEIKDKALQFAASEMDGYLQVRHTLPLTKFPEVLRLHNANMAAWHLLRRRGIRPDSTDDEIVRLGYTDAIKWLRDVASGKVTMAVLETAPAADRTPDIDIESDPDRGWGGNFAGEDNNSNNPEIPP
jgi:phage gp36-like protein